jgi:arylsulfatase A
MHFLLRGLLLLLLLFTGLGQGPAAQAAESRKPNIVLILTDDLGWSDLGCCGSTFYETPNIDRLAGQGMRFTTAYAACTVCSPTRASILTGQYPARLHLTDWIAGHVRPRAKLKVPDWTMHLPLETQNLARALHPAGYATASIGKWHLGKEPYWPEKQGFDLNIGGCDKGQPPSYFAPYKIPTLKEGPKGEFLSDRLTAEAVQFIEKNQDRPFLLYLPHYAVHTPLMARPEAIEKYRKKADSANPHHNATYAGLIESVDDSVGVLLRTLDRLKLSDNTIVIFTSDNGGLIGNRKNPVTSNLPLRAGKGTAYEGGVRVPLIVKWPGVTRAGSLCQTAVMNMDLFPTILALAGVSADRSQVVDGENLEPLLREKGDWKREALYWHYPHYHTEGATPYGAIRKGDLRLIEFYEDNRMELYDLAKDPGEKDDLAKKRPEDASALREELHRWRQRVGAQMPTPNPKYDPHNPNGK